MPTKRKKKILIVEDEAALRSVLRDNLLMEGYQVLEAADGKEGLKAAVTHSPDLILLDLLLPKMDGMTMVGKLREHVKGKRIPVMLLTNLAANETIIRGVVEHVPIYYFEKSGQTLGEIIDKVKRRL